MSEGPGFCAKLTKCALNIICYLNKIYLLGSQPSSNVSSVPIIARVILSHPQDLPLTSRLLGAVLRFKYFSAFSKGYINIAQVKMKITN